MEKTITTVHETSTNELTLDYFMLDDSLKLYTESDDYKIEIENLLKQIRDELMDRRYICPACKSVLFIPHSSNEYHDKVGLVRCRCGEIMVKIPDLKISDNVKIVGYNSVDDIENMELDDNLLVFLKTSGKIIFKITEFLPYDCSCKVEGFSDWIEAEIFEKVE